MTMRRIDMQSVKYLAAQREMARWMGAVLGEDIEAEHAAGSAFKDYLADGQTLARLMNVLKDGSVQGVHKEPKIHQYKVENVMLVTTAFRAELEVADVSLFQPTDLVDGKNMPKVLLTLGYVADSAHAKGLTAHKLRRPKHDDAADFSAEQIEHARKDLEESGLKNKFGGDADDDKRSSLASAFAPPAKEKEPVTSDTGEHTPLLGRSPRRTDPESGDEKSGFSGITKGALSVLGVALVVACAIVVGGAVYYKSGLFG